MQPVEIQIYATVWAEEYQDNTEIVPPDIIRYPEKYEQFEIDAATSAAEVATHAVLRFRSMGPAIKDGFEGFETHDLYMELIDGNNS